MKILIAGSRTITNIERVFDILDTFSIDSENDIIISGNCPRGVDRIGELYAEHHNMQTLKFPADWDKYGKSAGYIRNAVMAKECDSAIIIWDGESAGSKNMIKNMIKVGKPFKDIIVRQYA